MLRLLDKKEINTLQAKEKNQAVQEGLKLTRRIDGLRELEAETESNYEKFRSSALQGIHKEVEENLLVKEQLDRDIQKQREKLDELLKPLSLEKLWVRYVTEEKAKIDGLRAEWENRNIQAISQSEEYKRLSAQALISKEKYDESFKENGIELTRISSLKKEAEKSLVIAQKESASLIRNANLSVLNAQKKEQEVSNYEVQVKLRVASLDAKEQELEKREMQVLIKELKYNSPIKRL